MMSNIEIAPHRYAAQRGLRYLAPVHSFFDDGSALSDEAVNEFAIRLLEVRSEAEFEHLLGAIITHAANRAGGALSAQVGSALGGLLKCIARHGLTRKKTAAALGLDLEGLDDFEREFEAMTRFVRLAGEAARHLADAPLDAPPNMAARAAMAAASDLYAPPLISTFAPHHRGAQRAPAQSHQRMRGDTRFTLNSPTIAVWIEPFEYDPEMEYFLGGIISSVGKAFSDAGRAVGKAVRDVGRTVGKVVEDAQKIPILGDVVRAGIGAVKLNPLAFVIDAGSRLARGEDLWRSLKGAAGDTAGAFRDVSRLAQMVVSFVPGVGQGVSAALAAANALAEGRPITEALLAAAKNALPGGPLAAAAFDVALNLAQGKNIGEAALAAARDRLPNNPLVRAAFDGAVALGQGKKLQDAAFAAAGKVLPPSPYAADALSFVQNVAKGQNIQNAALSVVGQRVVRHVQANGALKAMQDAAANRIGAVSDIQKAARALAAGRPITAAIFSAARGALPGGAPAKAAFDVVLSLAKRRDFNAARLAAARNSLPGGAAARVAFDRAIALVQGKRLQDTLATVRKARTQRARRAPVLNLAGRMV